ncbi:DUF4440 domain-containing protein [uncultured Nitratireductor sp.]|uniref:DUF4440 domain-containing protein n=1 Tax=uncultured Nitratireductor sp. TaxID=520953 RepID=UPI0025E580FE|nr:DUF4440 domain-containing protein [uncultured Nitratireductor sp.]
MKLHRLPLILAIVAITIPPSLAEETDILAKWFDALRTADREQLSDLLAEDARVVLNDIGIEQTKAEFLDSLDAWETASGKGTDIRYRLEEELGTTKVVTVCYEFPGNSVLTSERFRIEKGKIEQSDQSQIAEDCDDI